MMVVVEVDVRRVAGSKPRVERPGLSTPEPVAMFWCQVPSLFVSLHRGGVNAAGVSGLSRVDSASDGTAEYLVPG